MSVFFQFTINSLDFEVRSTIHRKCDYFTENVLRTKFCCSYIKNYFISPQGAPVQKNIISHSFKFIKQAIILLSKVKYCQVNSQKKLKLPKKVTQCCEKCKTMPPKKCIIATVRSFRGDKKLHKILHIFYPRK